MTPADELRAAVTRLRCDHDFRFPLPGCGKCGVDARPAVDELAEPLATWLEMVASGWEKAVGMTAAARAAHPGLAAARALNGGAS